VETGIGDGEHRSVADMGVVIAPDKFKGSLTAPEVARHLAAGLRLAAAGVPVAAIPISDGDDGFLDAMAAAGYRRVPVAAEGPVAGGARRCRGRESLVIAGRAGL
jgi:glycerate kinase